GILGECDAVLAAEGLAAQELDAGDAVADHLQLLDLVDEAADLRLLELLAAERLFLLGADAANAIVRLAPRCQAAPFKLARSLPGRGDRLVDVVENAPAASVAVGRSAAAVAHVEQDFLNDVADEFVGDLHDGFLRSPHQPWAEKIVLFSTLTV